MKRCHELARFGTHLGDTFESQAGAAETAASAVARQATRQVAVVTFEPLPQAFFRPAQAPARLTTVYQKLNLLNELNVDTTWLMRVDGALAAMSARDFAGDVLQRGLAASQVVVGEDFRFGQGREGDVALLRELGCQMDFSVTIVPAVTCQDDRVSSTAIRAALARSDFAAARQLLGRDFRMEGHVVVGQRLGRKLGYPTANIRVRARPYPLQGIFAVYCRVAGGDWLPAVSSLGVRPTVGGEEPLLEVHFFDFAADLYGQRLEVHFVAKLRDETHFGTIEELVVQMQRDEAEARHILTTTQQPG